MSNLRLPPLKVCAAMVLAMLGFGVLIGEAARSSEQDALLAYSARHVRLVLPAHQALPSTAAEEPSASTQEQLPATPEAESQPAPSAPRAKTPSRPRASKPSSGEQGGSSEGTPATKLPAFKHVFVIMLSDEPYAAVFGPESLATYLTHQLEPHGALLARYDAVAHEQLPNEIALLSGQGATSETVANCPDYTLISPASVGPQEQVLGDGCVYPASTQTLLGQLSAKHLDWRAYIEGMDEAGAGAGAGAGACAHPTLGQADPTGAASAGTGAYATYINPVAYFASLTGSAGCASEDVGIASLARDLAKPARTPSFSYIAPSRCDDGDPVPCDAGAQAGVAPADAFLKRVVPEITGSAAYKQSGLLVITVDEAPSSGEFADSSSCCGQPAFPNLPAALSETPSGRPRGGGAVGALLLSPLIKGPETSQEPYNHYSLLATIEETFGLKRLGYAGLAAVKPVEPSLFRSAAG